MPFPLENGNEGIEKIVSSNYSNLTQKETKKEVIEKLSNHNTNLLTISTIAIPKHVLINPNTRHAAEMSSAVWNRIDLRVHKAENSCFRGLQEIS